MLAAAKVASDGLTRAARRDIAIDEEILSDASYGLGPRWSAHSTDCSNFAIGYQG